MKPKLFSISILALSLSITGDAGAITAGDVMEKMTDKERFGYLTGLVDMLSYQHVLAGDRPRAQCVTAKFYDETDMQARIIATFARYPDKSPEGIVVLLMNKACGT